MSLDNAEPLWHKTTFTVPVMPWWKNWHIWAIIPARGGSKGIPHKNIYPLLGKPLLAWTLEDCQQSELLTRYFVSTDDEEIATIARDYGAEVVMRPAEYSGDFSPSEDAIRHVLSKQEIAPDLIVMLQATAPIRDGEDIDAAIRLVRDEGYDSLLSGVRLHQFVWRGGGPYGVYSVNYQPMAQRPMRQAVEEWVENGSIYVCKREVFEHYGTRLGGKIGLYEMPYWSRLEIDDLDDVALVEWVMQRWGK